MADGFLDSRARLSGKVAAVIGGGFGIGAAISRSLAGAGVDLAVLDIDAEALPQTVAECESAGRRVTGMVGDATDPATLEGFYANVQRDFSRLDIVVNVVGGVRHSPLIGKAPEECAREIQRNYGYVIESVRHAVPLIRRGGRGGSIVNFTTIEAHRRAAGFAVYAGAKAATANFTRSMAVELAPERIRLNALAPDITPSRGNMQAMAPEIFEDMSRLPPEVAGMAMRMYIPMKDPPQPDDLANGVLFLASDLAAFVTGTTLHVDGGTKAASGFIDWPYGDGFLPAPMAGTLRHFVRDEGTA
jgi:NAD(P)-dependent dehydrogenase (short-subunit alcohol dehydrogenase family)